MSGSPAEATAEARAKLKRAARPLAKEKWRWVDVWLDFQYEDRAQFERRYPEPEPLPPEQQARLESLEREHAELSQQDQAPELLAKLN